jgi:putative FmdB family regulatory protein
MPTYEYECKSCGHTFEAFQAMSDEPLKNCPQCGKEVRRLIFGGTGVIFKGSGFYVTDKGKGVSAKTSKPSETAPNAGGGGAASSGASSGAGSGPEKSPASKSESAESAPKKSEAAGTTEKKAKTA